MPGKSLSEELRRYRARLPHRAAGHEIHPHQERLSSLSIFLRASPFCLFGGQRKRVLSWKKVVSFKARL